MLTQEQIATFQRDGCLHAGQVLTDAEVDELRAELQRVIDGETKREPLLLRNLSGKDDAPVWQIVNIWQASDAFERLIYHPKLVTIVAEAMGVEALRIWHDQIQYKPAATGGTNHWHQDGPYWPSLDATTMVTAWVALDDVDETNGCMSMVPGSHQWGNHIRELEGLKGYDTIADELQRPDGSRIDVVLWPVPKGHLSLHHCLTWHGSHSNTSGRPRRAIALHYMADGTPHNAHGEHVMSPFIKAGHGEPIQGEAFPLVYQDGRPVREAAARPSLSD